MENQPSHSRHQLGRSDSQPESRPSPSIHHSRRFDGTGNAFHIIPIIPLIRLESWVELSSQPSSSSLSSVDNEIVTTGLQVGASPFQRRRRLHPSARSLPPQQQTVLYAAGASSQDEEDESDSDEDQVMSSSAENIHSSEKEPSDGSDDESDDGDNATTLGRNSDAAPVFRPHPNAFTHPPAGLAQRSYSTSSAEQPHPHSSFRRSSYPHRPQARGHRGAAPDFMSPSLREDNDAALRASLTTLLSCAAAARGLPKNKGGTDAQRTTRTGVAPSNQPMELRFMPESELAGEDKRTEEAAGAPATAAARRRRPSSGAVSPKSKRSESAGRGGPRPAKKKRTSAASAEDALLSPTVLSWVVSAGVVVLVSVVGFGAGYVIGREVGREEAREVMAASVSGVNDTASAGSDVVRSSVGLRKLRWSAVGRSIVAQA